MGKEAPTPGNYTGAAQQQAKASAGNVDAQTTANRANVNGAFANQKWTKGPDGTWTLDQGFSGGIAPIAGALQQQALDAYGKPLDDGSAARDQTTKAAYDQAKSRLDPRFAQQDQQQQSTLANQGLDPNSAAARASNLQYGQMKNDAYSSAMNGAIDEGNRAGSQVFQNNLAARNNPLQQLLALSGTLNGTTPQYNTAGLAETPQTLAALMGQDSANLQAYQAQQKATADAISGGAQLLGAGAKAFGF